jgi:hypothetical protein
MGAARGMEALCAGCGIAVNAIVRGKRNVVMRIPVASEA